MTYTTGQLQSRARLMRAQGANYITIHRQLGVGLSVLRTWLDPKAADFHHRCRCEESETV